MTTMAPLSTTAPKNILDEPVELGKDVLPHPGTTMDPNAEFLTQRPLKVKLLTELPLQD